MNKRLPPLLSLRAFEAAARHLSFTKAATELFVTQAAISHQIKQLEEQLGQPLFRRLTRKLLLTDAGRRLLPKTSEAFDLLTQAVAELDGTNERHLTVSTSPSFGARWLAPRLGRFAQSHPEIELRIHHSIQLVDLKRDGVDLAIRYGRGSWPGLKSELLQAADQVPVAARELLESCGPLEKPADALDFNLLHSDGYGDWMEWMKTAGLDPLLARRGTVFDDDNALLAATLAGQGLALIARPLVSDDIAAGRLVQAWKSGVGDDFAYYIVYPPEALRRPKNQAFRDFLLREAKR